MSQAAMKTESQPPVLSQSRETMIAAALLLCASNKAYHHSNTSNDSHGSDDDIEMTVAVAEIIRKLDTAPVLPMADWIYLIDADPNFLIDAYTEALIRMAATEGMVNVDATPLYAVAFESFYTINDWQNILTMGVDPQLWQVGAELAEDRGWEKHELYDILSLEVGGFRTIYSSQAHSIFRIR